VSRDIYRYSRILLPYFHNEYDLHPRDHIYGNRLHEMHSGTSIYVRFVVLAATWTTVTPFSRTATIVRKAASGT
jgi:hypothetical protein